MSNNDRSGALARRYDRLVGYFKAGKSVPEICDLEGLDAANEPRRVLRPAATTAGLPLSMGPTSAVPSGLLDLPSLYRYNLGQKLRLLRDHNHYADVAQMTGLTNSDQQRAMKTPYTHNWTLGQLQRLAVASRLSFEELLTYMQQSHVPDFRKKS